MWIIILTRQIYQYFFVLKFENLISVWLVKTCSNIVPNWLSFIVKDVYFEEILLFPEGSKNIFMQKLPHGFRKYALNHFAIYR